MSKKGQRSKRRRFRFYRRTLPGALPGSIVADPGKPRPSIQVMAFGPDELVEVNDAPVDSLRHYLDRYGVTWVNVNGLGDAATIRQLGELFGLHALALEDVVNVHQRAKTEPYEDHLFLVARMVLMNAHLESEQVSLFLGRNYVLTFQERAGDCFDPVRERIRKNHGRIRKAGSDHLMYALLDAVIDSYFPVVEHFADHLDEIEDQVMARDDASVIDQIHTIRNDLLLLRRSIRPHRDSVNELIRDEHPLIDRETRVFLRDCYDHTVQLIELLEVYREMCSDLRDYQLSTVSNRMNEIMKVLTIIATIFIPLSFIAGVYGMNFDTRLRGNMPELEWPFGYVFALSLMVATALGMLLFFRRKGWLGGD